MTRMLQLPNSLLATTALLGLFFAIACGGGVTRGTIGNDASNGQPSVERTPVVEATPTAPRPTPTRRPQPTPVARELAMTAMTCTRADPPKIKVTGRVQNVGAEVLNGLRAELVLIDGDNRQLLHFLNHELFAGYTYSGPARPSLGALAGNSVSLTPSALEPGAEAVFEFPAVDDPWGSGTRGCTALFIMCTPDCIQVPVRRPINGSVGP